MCKANTTSTKRSGWRVLKQFGKRKQQDLRKILVTSIHGHEDMLDYLSDYRTQDSFKGKHYYPSGALCWFETNKYGDPIGSVYYVRKIPDLNLLALPLKQRGYKKLIEQKNKKKNINEILAKEIDLEERSFKKPQIHQ